MDKNSFAPRPPMGWNSYDYYDTNVTEADVLANAEYMAMNLKPYGWEYVVVDIQWYAYDTASMREKFQYIPFGRKEMDAYGRLLPCPEKFPSARGGAGFRELAARIHELGLKFGIHIMRGIPRAAAEAHLPVLGTDTTADMVADPASICGWNPDMYGVRDTPAGQAYYDSLLALYASWGVDFIKCDDICVTNLYPTRLYSGRHEIEMLHRAIARCGRPIVLSLSPGPALLEQSAHYRKYANMWRVTDDFWDTWPALRSMFDTCERWQDHVSAGCYPDCDMLPLGLLGKGFGQERPTNFTPAEQQTMLTLWCIFSSPLMLGAELTKLDTRTLTMLQNPELLRLENGRFRARQVRRDAESRVWAAVDPQTGEWYLALFNLSERAMPISASLAECAGMLAEYRLADARFGAEVWSGRLLAWDGDAILAEVEPHGVRLLHMEPQ